MKLTVIGNFNFAVAKVVFAILVLCSLGITHRSYSAGACYTVTSFTQSWCQPIPPNTDTVTVSFAINESISNNCFKKGQTNETIILDLPAGFEFDITSATADVSRSIAGDITACTFTFTSATRITVTLTTFNGANNLDTIFFDDFEIYATVSGSNGDLLRNGGTFKINNRTNNPTESLGNLDAQVAMSYTSSTVTQNNTTDVNQGSINNEIIGIEIVLAGGCSTLDVTQFDFNTVSTPGSTDPLNDIIEAKVYYTGTSSTFATTNLFGTLGGSPNGAFNISGSQTVEAGTVYFWLTYDISGGATAGNDVDARLDSFQLGGTWRTDMIVSDPGGKRTIAGLVTYYSFATGNWNDNLNWSLDDVSGCFCQPTGSGTVIINSGHTIDVDADEIIDIIDILNGGVLTGAKNLTLNSTFNTSGTGILSITMGTVTVSGNMTLSGTGASSIGGLLDINGDLNVGSGTSLERTGGGGGVFSVAGNLILDGTIIMNAKNLILDGGAGTITNSGTGNVTGTGQVIINADKVIPGTTVITFAPEFVINGPYTVTNSGLSVILGDLTGTVAASQWTQTTNSTLRVAQAVLTTGVLDATATDNNVVYNGPLGQTVKATDYYNLSASGGNVTTLSGNMNILGDANITGTLDANGFNINVKGNWTNSGTFIPGTGTVVFDAPGPQTIDNNNQAFYGLEAAGSGTKTLGGNLIANGDLTITSALDVGADYSIDVGGNWSKTGTFTGGAGTVTFNGGAPQTISGSGVTVFNNLTINNTLGGVSITAGSYDLINTLTLTNGVFNTNNDFTLISNAIATARIAEITGGDISGDIVMQRYINAGATGWHFISTPVSGTTLNDWDQEMVLSCDDCINGMAGSFYSVYRYNEAAPGTKDNGYVALTNISAPINADEGYWVYTGTGPTTTTPFTFDVSGPANKFATSLSVSYNPSGLPDDDGWNLVANPYPSTIDWDVAGWARTNIGLSIYIWDPDAQVYASYTTFVGGVNGGTQYIPSSQAFWVKAIGAPVLSVTEPVKSSQDQSYFKVTSIPNVLRLKISGAGYADETMIHFAQGANFAFDSDLDAYKLSDAYSPAPYLATVIGNSTDLSINSLPELTQDTSIPLRATWIGAWWISGENDTFTIYASDFSTLPLSTCILLEDLQTGVITNLRTDSSIFTLSDTTSASSPRFLLHLGIPIIKGSIAVSCNGGNDGAAIAQGNGTGPWDYQWINESGDTIKVTQNISAPDTVNNLPAGVYTVKVTNGSVLCGNVSDTIIITQPDSITAYTGQTNVSCKNGNDGSATLITIGGTPPYTYSWNTIPVQTGPVATGLSLGIYTVAVTDNNGCVTLNVVEVTEPATITSANFTTNADTAYLSEGGAVQFTNNSIGASSYLWDFGDGVFDTLTHPVHSYTNTGMYTATLIAINGICQDTFTYNIIILDYPPVSIQEVVDINDQIKILPAENGATIEFNFDQLTNLKLSVFNLLGQKVIEDKNIKVKRDIIEVDLSKRFNGIYFIKMTVKSMSITRKFNYF